jgi:hypothetical protein
MSSSHRDGPRSDANRKDAASRHATQRTGLLRCAVDALALAGRGSSQAPTMLRITMHSDVDDLKEGKGAELVDDSAVFLIFCSSGYFDSPSTRLVIELWT